MTSGAGWIGPLLYGALFVILLPVILVAWAAASGPNVALPAIHEPWLGAPLVGIGLAMCLAGMYALKRHGDGLPMNAFPPPTYVARGIYRYLSHPIYVGFGAICFGAAIWEGSVSGLWLVAPVASLAALALVLGYERHDLERRFGVELLHRPLLAIPAPGAQTPSRWDRASILVLVLLPWALAYEAVFRLGIPPDAVEVFLPFERGWPVWLWTEAVYASVYAFVIAVPFIARTTGVLRHFAWTGLFATAFVTLVYVTVPVVAPPRPFDPTGPFGRMLEIERLMSHTVAAFPAFHVLWTLTAAEVWVRTFPRWSLLWWLWAAAICASCLTTGMHAVADVAFAAALWPIFRGYRRLWERVRRGTERVANSWRTWRWGPLRLLNHGFYAGLAGVVGLWGALSLVGAAGRPATLMLFVFGLGGAALWAQRLEGSPSLSRPFGYFGSVAGASAGALLVWVAGWPVMLPVAAVATMAPWVQAIGRLRCLVQGCCHGSPCSERVGIRYQVPNSRVLQLADLGHRPLHPTPLYSILGNLVLGVFLARLWSVGAALPLITGLYLILAGLFRFVEESYRGEPQTPVLVGLRLYQWTALGMLLAGLFTSSLAGPAAPEPSGWLSSGTLLPAAAMGFVALAAMGVDFPESTRRYARLSG